MNSSSYSGGVPIISLAVFVLSLQLHRSHFEIKAERQPNGLTFEDRFGFSALFIFVLTFLVPSLLSFIAFTLSTVSWNFREARCPPKKGGQTQSCLLQGRSAPAYFSHGDEDNVLYGLRGKRAASDPSGVWPRSPDHIVYVI
ncbi:hypothetical protein BT93_E1870 [Corymbia citriodora subsp. variegata]|nr:hypothetical protein BT93_E1870 [Corymbia citriodora subsp. variegata]